MALSAIEHQTLCLPAPAAPQTFGSGSVLGLLCWHGIRANLSRLPAHRTRPVSCRVSGLWPGFESRARAVTVHFHGRGIGHGVLHIRLVADGIKEFFARYGLAPVAKALEDGVAFAKFFRPIAPGAACAHDPRHGLCKSSAYSRLLALHRQACPGSAGSLALTACRLILIFPWRDCSHKR